MEPRQPDDAVDAELEFHFAEAMDALVEQGWTPEAARLEIERRFGDRAHYREQLHGIGQLKQRRNRRAAMVAMAMVAMLDMMRGLLRWPRLYPSYESLAQDVRFGLRLFRRNPTTAAAAMMSLSLGLGACAAAFALIDALILRPLPVQDPQRLVYLVHRASGDANDFATHNYPLFTRLRDAGRSHVRLFAMSHQPRRDARFDDAGGMAEKVYAQWISGDALTILGVKAAIGRLLTADDDVKPGQHQVAVISHDFWTRRFGASPEVLGRWVTIREKQLQITDITTQSTLVNNVLVRERLLALLSAFFAMVAVLLIAVGLYGILSYNVVARTREIGVRLALGARPLGVMLVVVKQVGLMMTIGLALGVAGGIFASGFACRAVLRGPARRCVEPDRAVHRPAHHVRPVRAPTRAPRHPGRPADRAAKRVNP